MLKWRLLCREKVGRDEKQEEGECVEVGKDGL